MKQRKLPIFISICIGGSLAFLITQYSYLKETISSALVHQNHYLGQINNELPIYDFEISPDGKKVITAGPIAISDKILHGVKVWDTNTRRSIRILAKDDSDINDVVFLSNGSKIATSHDNGDIKIWNFQSGEVEKKFSFPNGGIISIAVNDDRYIVAKNRFLFKMQVWDLKDSSSCSIDSKGNPFKFSSNPVEPKITGYSTGGGLRSIDLMTCETGQTYEIDKWRLEEGPLVNSGSFITFLQDGKSFISNVDNRIEIWDIQKPKSIDTFEGHKSEVLAVTAPNDRLMISSSLDNTIRFWDLQNKTIIKTISVPSKYLEKLVTTPDGETLLTRGEDNSIQFWDIKSLNNF